MKKLRILVLCIVTLCFLFAVSLPLMAEEPLSCTLDCRLPGGEPVVGEEFCIYQVATIGNDLTYKKTAAFQKYPVVLENLTSVETKALGETLAAYVARDRISPTDRTTSDVNGIAIFPSEGKTLKPGLYLILGQPFNRLGNYYETEPIVLALPCQDGDDEAWLYDVTVAPKITMRSVENQYSVVKIWKDQNNTDRADSIEVQLLRDGVIYDTQVLSAANNWRYTWSNLPPDSKWQVTEKNVPKDYSVSVLQEETTFTVTNTYQGNDTPENTTTTGSNKPGKLPQTGMLLWPVPVLAAVGMLLLLLGVFLRRRDH